MKINVDQPRVEAVLSTLYDRYTRRQPPYDRDDMILPHDHRLLPPNLELGGLDHARFLWSLYPWMRGRIKSTSATRGLSRLYVTRPDLFDPEVAAGQLPSDLFPVFTSVGLGSGGKRASEHWADNAFRLLERYDGDPREIFAGVDNYEEACYRVCNRPTTGEGFWGFQEKMTSMMLYYLMDEGMIDFFYFPTPVDFHVLRLFVSNELVNFRGRKISGRPLERDLLPLVRGLCHDFAVRHQLDQFRLCDALWLLSSKMCARQPGNLTIVGKADGHSTPRWPKPVTWSPAQRRTEKETCGSCPLSGSCVTCIPSAEYYYIGAIDKRSPRPSPP